MSKKNLTYAEIAKRLGRTKKRYEKLAEEPDSISRDTAALMLNRIDTKLDQLFEMQEASKGPGKSLPNFQKGGDLPPEISGPYEALKHHGAGIDTSSHYYKWLRVQGIDPIRFGQAYTGEYMKYLNNRDPGIEKSIADYDAAHKVLKESYLEDEYKEVGSKAGKVAGSAIRKGKREKQLMRMGLMKEGGKIPKYQRGGNFPPDIPEPYSALEHYNAGIDTSSHYYKWLRVQGIDPIRFGQVYSGKYMEYLNNVDPKIEKSIEEYDAAHRVIRDTYRESKAKSAAGVAGPAIGAGLKRQKNARKGGEKMKYGGKVPKYQTGGNPSSDLDLWLYMPWYDADKMSHSGINVGRTHSNYLPKIEFGRGPRFPNYNLNRDLKSPPRRSTIPGSENLGINIDRVYNRLPEINMVAGIGEGAGRFATRATSPSTEDRNALLSFPIPYINYGTMSQAGTVGMKGMSGRFGAPKAGKAFVRGQTGDRNLPTTPMSPMDRGANFRIGGGSDIDSFVPGLIDAVTQNRTGTTGLGTTSTMPTGDKLLGALTTAGQFADNIVNAFLTSRTPQVPSPAFQDPITLDKRFNISPQLSELERGQRTLFREIDRVSGDSPSSIARKLAGYSQGLSARNQLYGEKANIETQLRNQETLANTQIERENLAKLDLYNQLRTQREANILGKTSQNITNAADKFLRIQQEKAARELDREKLDIIAKATGIDISKLETGENLSEEVQQLRQGTTPLPEDPFLDRPDTGTPTSPEPTTTDTPAATGKNTPLNLRPNSDPNNPWQGQVGTRGNFAQTDTVANGVRADLINFGRMVEEGNNTLSGIIARWAPAGDGTNDPVAYATQVAEAVGIGVNDTIDHTDKELMRKIYNAMAKVEGGTAFTNRDFNTGWAGYKSKLGF